MNDSNTAWLTPVTPDTATSVSNSQCTLYGDTSSIETTPTGVIINFGVGFENSYVGTRALGMMGVGRQAGANVWQTLGSYLVTAQ